MAQPFRLGWPASGRWAGTTCGSSRIIRHAARRRCRPRAGGPGRGVGPDRGRGLRRSPGDDRHGGLDGVVIAAPTTAHPALAAAGHQRGLPVLIEKPLAAGVDEGLSILLAARRRGVRVQVGHVERYNPAVLEMGRLIHEGWLSTVYAITCRRAGPSRPGSATSASRWTWAPTTSTSCRGSPGNGPSGSTPRRPGGSRQSRGPDLRPHALPVGRDRLPGRGLADPGQATHLGGSGRGGMFELDYLTQRLTFTRTDVERPQMIAGYATTFSGDVAEIAVTAVEPLRGQLDEFVRVLRTGDRPYVDAEDGLWAVAIATALVTSAVSATRSTCPTSPRGSPRNEHRQPSFPRRQPGRRLDQATAQPMPATRSRALPNPGPASPAPRAGRSSSARARWACRWPSSSRATAGTSRPWTSGRTQWRPSTPAARMSAGARPGGGSGRCPRRRAARRHDRCRDRRRGADVAVLIVPVMLDEVQQPDYRYMDSAVDSIGGGVHAGLTVIFETTLPVGDTRGRFVPRLERPLACGSRATSSSRSPRNGSTPRGLRRT